MNATTNVTSTSTGTNDEGDEDVAARLVAMYAWAPRAFVALAATGIVLNLFQLYTVGSRRELRSSTPIQLVSGETEKEGIITVATGHRHRHLQLHRCRHLPIPPTHRRHHRLAPPPVCCTRCRRSHTRHSCRRHHHQQCHHRPTPPRGYHQASRSQTLPSCHMCSISIARHCGTMANLSSPKTAARSIRCVKRLAGGWRAA